MAGRAWKFGDNISTDHIAPGRYFHLRSNLDELAKHVLEDARPDFPTNVKKGDFVVAGVNFGLGSSREHAPTIIKLVGVEAVLAKSFARIFYRNAVNIGLPVVICDTSLIDDGDLLTIDLSSGVVFNHTKNLKIRFPPLPAAMKKILEEGGLIPYVKRFGDLPL
ncbi:MAG: 3-isopropylmalate dehydratase small subunit [Nitrososphaerales archaeon]